MSRKSLLLIAAAVISIPALTSSNALAEGSGAGHAAMPISRPHVLTVKTAGKVATPRAVSSGTARQVVSTHRSGLINPKDLNKAIKDATGSTATSHPGSVADAVRAVEKAATGSASNSTS